MSLPIINLNLWRLPASNGWVGGFKHNALAFLLIRSYDLPATARHPGLGVTAMYHILLVECFPSEDLPVLYECVNRECYFHETLMKWSEVEVKERWSHQHEDLIVVPICPACHDECEEWSDQDGKI